MQMVDTFEENNNSIKNNKCDNDKEIPNSFSSFLWCPRKYSTNNRISYKGHKQKIKSQHLTSDHINYKKEQIEKNGFNKFEIESLNLKFFYTVSLSNNSTIENALNYVIIKINILLLMFF